MVLITLVSTEGAGIHAVLPLFTLPCYPRSLQLMHGLFAAKLPVTSVGKPALAICYLGWASVASIQPEDPKLALTFAADLKYASERTFLHPFPSLKHVHLYTRI